MIESMWYALLIGVTFWGSGWLTQKFPPKKINPIYGYRTRRSRKSKEAWVYAQKRSSEMMKLAGLAVILFSLPVCLIPQLGEVARVILITLIMIVVLCIMIFKIENELKERFE